jgi:hypothetical protein
MKLIFGLERPLYNGVWFWTARNISMAGIPLALIVHITSSLPVNRDWRQALQCSSDISKAYCLIHKPSNNNAYRTTDFVSRRSL